MEDYALPLWMYVAVLVVLVCGAMKRLLAPSLLAWLGATVLVERLWSVCLPAVMLLLILLAVYLYASTRTAAHTPTLSPRGKAVLITGCDSGFGKATAKHLDSLGLEVFATVLDLSGEGARELQRSCSAHLTLLQVDITQPQQIQQALLDVKAKLGLRGLWGLVNNAGVCVNFGEAELSLMSNFRGCMEVNFFGTLNVTKSFLPLLRHTKGRVINISSPAGDLPFPCLSAYGASKAALNLLTDTLRHELQPWGVHVSTVQPSSYKTGHCSNRNYWDQQHKVLLQTLPPALLEDYGEDYLEEIKELFHKYNSHASTDFSPVVGAIVDALLAQQPQTRYFAGPGLGIMYFINTYCPYSISSRFLHRLFMKKTLAPRALRGDSTFNLNLSLHTNNNNNNNNNNNEEEPRLK